MTTIKLSILTGKPSIIEVNSNIKIEIGNINEIEIAKI